MSIDRPRGPRRLHRRAIVVDVLGTALVAVVAGVVLAAVWSDLPDRIATHWDGDGVADRFTARGPGFAALAIGAPVALALALTALMALVPRSAPGVRWAASLPVGLAAGVSTLSVGTAVGQRDGATPPLGLLIVAMFVVGAAATAAAAVFVRPSTPPAATEPPPADSPRLEGDAAAWWTGRARPSIVVAVAIAALLIAVAAAVAFATPTILAAAIVVPALVLAAALTSFRITIGGRQVVVSGALLRWPTIRIPVETVERAEVARVSIWGYGGIGLRTGPSGSGVITRNGEALILHRTDGTTFAVTCDDPVTAAATLNTQRDRAVSSCSSD